MLRLLCALVILSSCSTIEDKEYATKKPIVPIHKNGKRTQYESLSKEYMIATQGVYSSRAAKKMFEMGGNAFDAFAAASFTISVERPQSTGLGGGGFVVYQQGNESSVKTLDFREKAPLKGHSKMYLDENGEEIKGLSIVGALSVGVPGFVKGVVELHKKHGKLPLATVVEPAAKLAHEGFRVYPGLAFALKYKEKDLAKFKSSRKIFFKNKGKKLLEEGDLLVQKDLAKTIRSIGKHGTRVFYRGGVGRKIVKSVKKHGGMITANDLRKYHTVEREPVKGTYGPYEIYSMAPPSSGGTHVVQILNIIENDKLGQTRPEMDPRNVHLVAAAMQAAFADRAKYLGDADFVKVPVKGLTSKEYAREIRSDIDLEEARRRKEVSPSNPWPYESPETTHFTIADKEGNVISTTQTINGYFGSSLVAEGTGIVLNNEMDDFATKVGAQNIFGAVGGENNLVEPQKRPLSSMSPTIVRENGKFKMAVGTPSGTRILTCVAQTLINYLEFNNSLYDAVAKVRYHHQWAPDSIRIEPYAKEVLDPDFFKALEKMGYDIDYKKLGCRIQAVSLENGMLQGVSDPRGEGMAIGK